MWHRLLRPVHGFRGRCLPFGAIDRVAFEVSAWFLRPRALSVHRMALEATACLLWIWPGHPQGGGHGGGKWRRRRRRPRGKWKNVGAAGAAPEKNWEIAAPQAPPQGKC
eukprot:gene25139-biopygen17976